MTSLALFASTFALVLALGAQSLMVNNGRYVGAFCNSFAISAGIRQALRMATAPRA